MQQSNRPGQYPGRNDRASVEKRYIRPAERSGTPSEVRAHSSDSFQKVLVALIVILTVSLLVLVGVLIAGRIRNEELEGEISAVAAHNSEAQEIIDEIDAIVTAMTPVEEPDVYAAFTKDTEILTGIRSEFAILIDIAKNEVVAHKNGNVKMYPASMTKVMTLIVAYENIADMNETFTFDYTITDPAYKAGASIAGFLAGETVPMIDIMYGIALPSGADATTAVAVKIAGSEEAFVELMNEKVKTMGLENTHFVNASGLHDPDHYSTAHDIAKIFEYAMNIPLLEEILSTYMYTTTPTAQHPDGLLLVSTVFKRMYGDEPEVAEIIAGKTGYTHEALNCLVSCAETPDERRFILVTGRAVSTASEGQYGAVYDAFEIYKNYIPQS